MKNSGYATALPVTEALTLAIQQCVEKSGGRLFAFEGDLLPSAFLGHKYSGVPAALQAGAALAGALKPILKKMKNVEPILGVHVLRIPSNRLRKDLSNLGSLSKGAVRAWMKLAQSMKPGIPPFVTTAASAVGGPQLQGEPIKKHPRLILPRKTPGPKAPSKKGPRPVEAENLAKVRLDPQLQAEPLSFSVTAFRILKLRGKEGREGSGGLPKDPFSRAREVVSLLGGEPLKGPKDCFFALFTHETDEVDAAARAVRCALLAPFELRSRLAKRGAGMEVSVGVASGRALHGAILKRTGSVFRKALQTARSLATNPGALDPWIDETTRERVQDRYVFPSSEAGPKKKGRPIRDPEIPVPQVVLSQASTGFPDAGFGAAGRRIRDLLKKCRSGNRCSLASFQAEEATIRDLGEATLCETARRLGWRVHSIRCGPASSWQLFGAWKGLVDQIAGIRLGDGPDRVKRKLVRVLGRFVPKWDKMILERIQELFHVAEGGVSRTPIPTPLKRQIIEKGFHQLLSGFTSGNPTLLLLSEWHDSDTSSQDFLHRFHETAVDTPLFVACFHSPSFTVRKPDLEVALKPLNATQSLHLTRGFLQAREIPKDLKKLVERLRGDPARIIESLAGWQAKGVIHVAEGKGSLSTVKIPKDPPLKELFQARFKRLPSPLKKSLGTAAVLGSRIDGPLFAAVHPESPLSTLLTLEKGGWLLPSWHSRGGEWAFRHEAIRAYATGFLNAKERGRIHTRAAEALRKMAASRHGEIEHRIAWHLKEAGNREAYMATLKRSGGTAKGLGFPAEAEACFRSILELPLPNDLAKALLIFEHAQVLAELGRTANAITQLETALKSKAVRVPKKKKSSTSA
ncbi:MAG: ATP-binding protein [Planctomycetota bacterium]